MRHETSRPHLLKGLPADYSLCMSTSIQNDNTSVKHSGNSDVRIAHLVIAQPEETFIGIEHSHGRFPLEDVIFDDGGLSWQRADAMVRERLDLGESVHVDALRAAFADGDGLMVVSYGDLQSHADSTTLEVAFVCAAAAPVASNAPRAAARQG